MPQHGQIESLRDEHRQLEEKIDEELQRPIPDTIRVQELKRLKLRIKDEIAKLSGPDGD